MSIEFITKRSGEVVSFKRDRIERAIEKAYTATLGSSDSKAISSIVDSVLIAVAITFEDRIPHVEEIQNIVERELVNKGHFDVARAYILYREERNKERARDIFKKRVYLKPYEYPELYEYVSAIRHSYWIHTEFNFVGDVQNFKVNVDEKERNVIQNAMLAIAQIEVAVKTGCSYFTFNIPNTICNKCGYVSKHKLMSCPIFPLSKFFQLFLYSIY